MSSRAEIEQTIAVLEGQRAILGDAVVNPALLALREKLIYLNEPSPSEERRQPVTILFADLVKFTTLAETHDPEEVRDLLNRYFAAVTPPLTAYGGFIEKFIGDAIMAVFGLHQTREDDAERAVRAALDMQQALVVLNPQLELRYGLRLSLRIGIHSGPVVASFLGDGPRREFTVVGDTVNTANRMETAAPPNGILISQPTYRLVRGLFEVRPLAPIHMKGKRASMHVYVVEKARPLTFRTPTRGIEGVETQMVGRTQEFSHLQETFRRLYHAPQAVILTIIGEAGMGKSRLLYEFNNWVDLQPERAKLFKGRATQAMGYAPFALLRDILAFRFEIFDGDSAAATRQKLESGLMRYLGPAAVAQTPFIGHLLGYDFSHSPYLHAIRDDTQQIRTRAFHYLVQLFTALATEKPTIICLEDIHWADVDTLTCLEFIVSQCAHLPLFVIALARPTLREIHACWGTKNALHQQLTLEPLSKADTQLLLEEILHLVPTIPPWVSQLVLDQAVGNPFYVEELVKMLIDQRLIQPGEEQWEIVAEPEVQPEVPATITGLVQARLDLLSVEDRDTLQRAAVIGRIFWDEAVEFLRHEGRAERQIIVFGGARPQPISLITDTSLNTLAQRELVFRRNTSAFLDSEEYIFKHAILHEVAYQSILVSRRRRYHRAAAHWLIRRSGERVGEFAGPIADHFAQAEEAEDAAAWYARAGQQAEATFAHQAAVQSYQRTLLMLEKAPKPALALVAHIGLGRVWHRTAEYAAALTAYRTAHRLAVATGDAVAQVQTLRRISNVLEAQGHHQESLPLAIEAETLARTLPENHHRVLADAIAWRSWVHFRLGEFAAARHTLQEAILLHQTQGEQVDLAEGLKHLGIIYMSQGEYEQAQLYMNHALTLFQTLHDRRGAATVQNGLGEVARLQGDFGLAVSLYRAALDTAQEIGYQSDALLFQSNLGGALVGQREYAAAARLLEDVLHRVQQKWFNRSETCRFLAEAYLGLGRMTGAIQWAQQALALGDAAATPELIGGGWLVLGRIAAHLDEPVAVGEGRTEWVTARICFERSAAALRSAGLWRDLAWTLHFWAAHEQAQGNHPFATTIQAEAVALFEQLGIVTTK